MSRTRLLVQVSSFAVAFVGSAQAHAMPVSETRGGAEPVDAGIAQAAPATPPKAAPVTPPKAEPKENDAILVTGVRNSLAKARDKKRKSDTIVDVVEAEDIGKLPNNTIGDVVASIPGISVYRSEGEVNDIQLRGLGSVQTTLGGTPIESGADRVASIADLPADLVQSVEVYKTRTPDQVEGSGAGTININLRKPVDFKEGFTFSGNAAARYNNQSRRYNQTYSVVTNYRRDTAIGDVGAQLGFTVNHNPFLESQARNDPLASVQTRQVVGPQILPQPTFAPNQVAFFYVTGARTTPTVNGALQWAPDGDTSLTLEGTYARPRFDRYTNEFYLPVLIQAGSTNNLPALSNIVLVPGTNRMASVTVSPVTQVGPISRNQITNDSNFLIKLNGVHEGEYARLSAEIAYTGANSDFNELYTRNRLVNRPTIDFEFASDKFRYPMMNAVFSDVDLLDPNQYRFFGLDQNQASSQNRTIAIRSDVQLRTSWDPVERFDFGLRFTRREASRRERFRGVANLQIDRSLLPEGWNNLVPIAEGFGGTGVQNNARWLSYDRFAARENYDDMRQFLTQFNQAFALDEVPQRSNRNFDGFERTVAAYGTVRYRTKLLFPIDGLFGARVTNTDVLNRSLLFRTVPRTFGGVTSNVQELTATTGSGNYLNIEPTATMVVHFTPKFQTRLSYNVGIRRPSVDAISPFYILDAGGQFFNSGNPSLQPEKTTRYDASIEYYFGRVGVITINPFYWNLGNSFASFETLELIEETDTTLTRVRRPYNAGSGYRRGVEVQAQSFFTFLPGIFRNFGASVNYTYVDAKQTFRRIPGALNAAPASLPLLNTAKHVGNIAGLFERGTLNARVTYNYNGSILDQINSSNLSLSRYIVPRTWMDAAINYAIPSGPLRNLGFSLQIQNVLASTRRSFYGFPDQPRDVIYMARTYGGTIRYRF